jgi:hypothetical protein
MVAVIIGTSVASSFYMNQKYATAHSGCPSGGTSHVVTVKNGAALPMNTIAKQCDTLTITNADSTTYEMAFGLHEDHVPYDGVAEKTLTKNQSLTLTLKEVGNFRFHDHLGDIVQGTFTVQPVK